MKNSETKNSINLDELPDIITEIENIAENAGELLLQYAAMPRKIDHKGSIDLVTDADRASEELIIKELSNLLPEVPVMAEENTGDGKNAIEFISGEVPDTCWLVDPLDGTTNYAHGFPWWSVSIALWQKGSVLAGVVHNPVIGETFRAFKSGGSFLNASPIQVSKTENLKESLLATGFPYDRNPDNLNNISQFGNLLLKSRGVRRCGSAALDLCNVAAGRLDGYWEFKLKPWDTAAGSIIVEEACGIIGAIDDKCKWSPFTTEVIAAGPSVYKLLEHELKLQS